MIRRDAEPSTGHPPGWLLIDQREHARISAELFAGLPPQTQEDAIVGQVIRRHDDGWQSWDAVPGFDAGAGRPYDFREMPRSIQNNIWSRSVELVHDLGPLGQFMIAEHFLLLRCGLTSPSTHISNSRQPEIPSGFAAVYSEKAKHWLDEWVGQATSHRSAERAAAHVAKLKWLDSVSLWLCCAHRMESWSTSDDAGKPIVFTPRPSEKHDVTAASGGQTNPNVACDEIGVWPWPFANDQLTVATAARFLPKRRYPSLQSLQRALVSGPELSWRLLPND